MSKVFMNEIGFTLRHTCSTKAGSSGSPIILLENFKVIGIHLQGSRNIFCKNYNEGNFLFDSIEKFKILYIESHTKYIADYIKEEKSKERKSCKPFLPKTEINNDSTFSKTNNTYNSKSTNIYDKRIKNKIKGKKLFISNSNICPKK